MTLSGKCVCGAVSYTIPSQEEKEIELWACHCDTCRQWTSGILFSLSPCHPVFEGKENISVYQSTPSTERAFCRVCGSNLYFGSRRKQESTLNICAGTLDAYPPNLKLVREVFVDACPHTYALEKNDRQVLTRAAYDG